MTNKEAIKILKNIHSAQRTIMLSTNSKNLEDIMLLDCTALEMAEKALEENDKLKADIEQLNGIISRDMDKHECYVISKSIEVNNLKIEIKQLKAELEQSDSCDGCKHNFDRNEYYLRWM